LRRSAAIICKADINKTIDSPQRRRAAQPACRSARGVCRYCPDFGL